MLIHYPTNANHLIWRIYKRPWAIIAALFADNILSKLLIYSPNIFDNQLDNIYWARCVDHNVHKSISFYDIGSKEPVLVAKDTKQHIGQYQLIQISRNATMQKNMAAKKQIFLQGRFHHYRIDNQCEFKRNKINCENNILIEKDKLILKEKYHYIMAQTKEKKPCLVLQNDNIIDNIVKQMPSHAMVSSDNETIYHAKKYALNYEIPQDNFIIHDKDDDDILWQACDDIFCDKVSLTPQQNIIFQQTDALTSIDINLGSDMMTRKKTDIKPILKNIAHHIDYRQLSGLIVIDCPDFSYAYHEKKQLCQFLRQQTKKYTSQCDVLGMTAAGLIEITRIRQSPSWYHILSYYHKRLHYPYAHWHIWQAFEKIYSTITASSIKNHIKIHIHAAIYACIEQYYHQIIDDMQQQFKCHITYQLHDGAYDAIDIE